MDTRTTKRWNFAAYFQATVQFGELNVVKAVKENLLKW
jgi:hypothetical protein